MKVKNWACVNFSSISGKDVLRFLRKLGKMCLSIGMELSLEPSLLIQKNSHSSADIVNSLWTVHEFFDDDEMKKDWAKFLLVILPEGRISDEKVKEVCQHVGHAYQRCVPLHDMMLTKKYLEDVANEIKTKVIECNTRFDSCVDMSEDENSGLDNKESEDDGSDSEGTGTMGDFCKDMSEDDGSEQSDKKEMGSVQPYSSSDDFIEDGIPETPGGSNEDNDDGSSDDAKHLGDFLETKRYLPVGKAFMKRKGILRRDQVEGKVKIWACVCFSRMLRGKAYNFFQKLKYTCMSLGVDFSSLPRAFLHEISARPTDIEDTLWEVHDITSNGDQIDLLIVILPDIRDSDDKVEEVCKNMGVTYQCCLPKFARTQNKNYMLEAAREIKSKVVGHKKGPLRNAIPFVSEATIIFGADISHCAPGEGSISIASVVASMNWPEVSKYRSVVNCQPRSEVVINGDMVRELLFAFEQNTKQRPQKIIFFRHGIFESPLSHTLSDERGAIRKDGYEPPITFVVVASQVMSEMTNKSENILPGIGVGEDGPNPTEFEFFCNHAGLEGTSMLAHYRVIHDDNSFTIDEVKFICNNLCTPHHRWVHPEMPMVPPAFFASRVASLACSHAEEQRSLGLACDDPATLKLPKYRIH